MFFGVLLLCYVVWADTSVYHTNAGCLDKQCQSGKCDALILDSYYCSQCKGAGNTNEYAPVDGKCADLGDKGDAKAKAICKQHSSGKCTECGDNAFLSKDGCYKTGDALVGPGAHICAGASGSVCKEKTDKSFLIPGNSTVGDESVVYCGDSVGTEVGDKTYTGVEFCEECILVKDKTAANCTKCSNERYLKIGEATTTCVKENRCGKDHFARQNTTNGNQCIVCGDANKGGVASCSECTANENKAAAKCTRCINKIVKTENSITTCIREDECSGSNKDFFVKPAPNGKDQKACVACGDETNGTEHCKMCDSPKEDATTPTCTKCVENKYLKSARNGGNEVPSCVDADQCGQDFYGKKAANGNTCEKCNKTIINCAICNAASDGTDRPTCTKCSGSSYLKTENGITTCVSPGQCGEGFYEKDTGDKRTCERCVEKCKKCTDGASTKCKECEVDTT